MLRRPSCARTGYTASQAATIAVHEPASPRAARAVTRVASSEHFDAQQRLVRPWVSGDVVNRQGAERTRFEFWHSSGSPLVQELAHEAERVDLVVMLARRKTEQLCFQVR